MMNNDIILYLFKSTYLFSILYLVYKLAFSRTTFFQLNRWVLVMIIPFSIIAPLFNLSASVTSTQFQVILPEFITGTPLPETESLFSFHYLYIIFTISVLLLINLILKLIKIGLKINQLKKGNLHDTKPFSFFSFIYIPKNISDENKEVIFQHEKIHAQQFHSIDILIYELYKIIFWFNPLTWLAIKDVKTNHEYIADLSAAKNDLNSYTKVLVAQLLGVNCSDLANNFNYEPLIKKRIKMMKTKKTNRLIATSYSVIAPLAIVALLSASNFSLKANTPSVKTTSEEDVYDNVDQMPEFKGGMNELMKYLGSKIKYPEEAKNTKAEGTVFVSFIIDKTGKVKNAKVERGVESNLDNEALKVVSSMPNWTPGKDKGKEVNVKMVLPIKYQLN